MKQKYLAARIIEQSDRKVTVRTERGHEYVLDLDETAKAVATLLSDHAHEQRQGWSLNAGWYAQEIRLLAERCVENLPAAGRA